MIAELTFEDVYFPVGRSVTVKTIDASTAVVYSKRGGGEFWQVIPAQVKEHGCISLRMDADVKGDVDKCVIDTSKGIMVFGRSELSLYIKEGEYNDFPSLDIEHYNVDAWSMSVATGENFGDSKLEFRSDDDFEGVVVDRSSSITADRVYAEGTRHRKNVSGSVYYNSFSTDMNALLEKAPPRVSIGMIGEDALMWFNKENKKTIAIKINNTKKRNVDCEEIQKRAEHLKSKGITRKRELLWALGFFSDFVEIGFDNGICLSDTTKKIRPESSVSKGACGSVTMRVDDLIGLLENADTDGVSVGLIEENGPLVINVGSVNRVTTGANIEP